MHASGKDSNEVVGGVSGPGMTAFLEESKLRFGLAELGCGSQALLH